MENRRKTVYYVCYYAEPEFSNSIVSYPSVWSKIEYVSDVIKENGYDVCYVCPVMPLRGRFKKKVVVKDAHEKHVYFSAYRNPKISVINKMNALFQIFQILLYLLLHSNSEDRILIYHSMFHVEWTWILKKIFKRNFILEIEDIYSALSPEGVKFENKEWNSFELANGFLCVNSLIEHRIKNHAPKIISHGRYALPDIIANRKVDKCRLVYAGVIEQVRKGAFLAAEAMKYLPKQYELIILGFGKDADIDELKRVIEKINSEKGWKCIQYLGYMTGNDYLCELQQCSIALSTHMYDESNMKSADYTFPSKLLIYMANGLQIVAQNLQCLRTSKINDYIAYYEKPQPQDVAKAIQMIDINQAYNSRKKIQDLDREFCQQMGELLR